ncbi:hypothetical protein ROHU_015510 [Labeo rohita]|uniref:Uncharacterized protein n=1 Tax=Labeo rohita TaxID=84645 RepID=A0A498NN48_LABRO|nr:hypothetical protein ROHU_015510 [Labeo rohita]
MHSVPAARLRYDMLDGLFEVSRDTVNVHDCGGSPGQAKRNSCGEELQTWQTVILYHRSKVSLSSVVADLSDDIA